jgi:hypothetical protein
LLRQTKEEFQMPALLLALFPLLVLFNVPMAFAALGLAIVLLFRDRTSAARRPAPRRFDDNAI